jgi:hypothetical protein
MQLESRGNSSCPTIDGTAVREQVFLKQETRKQTEDAKLEGPIALLVSVLAVCSLCAYGRVVKAIYC